MAETSNPMMNRIQDFGNQIGQATVNAVEGMKSVADNVGTKANEFLADSTKRAEEAGAYISQRAGEATTAVGEQLKSAGDASAQVGEKLRATGDYIEQEGLEGIAADIVAVIKKNPLASILAGICLGFCMGRAVSRHH